LLTLQIVGGSVAEQCGLVKYAAERRVETWTSLTRQTGGKIRSNTLLRVEPRTDLTPPLTPRYRERSVLRESRSCEIRYGFEPFQPIFYRKSLILRGYG
jgi:hypothetical protein